MDEPDPLAGLHWVDGEVSTAEKARRVNSVVKRNASRRRRMVDPCTCEKHYTEDEVEFLKAMERYRRENRRPFPTYSEVLEIVRSLGYRKVAAAGPLPGMEGKR